MTLGPGATTEPIDGLFLLWFDPLADDVELDFHGDAASLTDHLWLVRSDLTRSRLYHRIKWQLPDDARLLVAPLVDGNAGWPKFKGMKPGALAWLRNGASPAKD